MKKLFKGIILSATFSAVLLGTTVEATQSVASAKTIKIDNYKSKSKAKAKKNKVTDKISKMISVKTPKVQKLSSKNDNHTDVYTYSDSSNTRNIPWEDVHTLAVNNGVITYYNAETDAANHTTYEKAISNWNALGVIKFVPTDDASKAAVILGDNHNISNYGLNVGSMTDAYGVTYLSNGVKNQTGVQVVVNFDSCNNAANDTKEAEYVATHEIGHSLGFAHDQYHGKVTDTGTFHYYEDGSMHTNVTVSHYDAQPIMASDRTTDGDNGGVIPLGTAEKNALIAHYGANGQGLQ